MSENEHSPADSSTPPPPPSATVPVPPRPPGAALNLADHRIVTDLFNRAAEANLQQPARKGASVWLPSRGRILVTGDLHDHGLNFQRILKLARLHESADHHLLLQEIIHGEYRINGRDLSVRTLARVAALKLEYPDQVHILMGNHELAQLGGEGILKGNISVVELFDAGVDFIYADDAEPVRAAMARFIRSMLLAVRGPGGLFFSHSLPSPRKMEGFDPAVIDRVPTDADLAADGSGHDMVWGRYHNQEQLQKLAAVWNAKLFIMGHQPAEMGYEIRGDRVLIVASDHSHGVALPLDLGRRYDMDALVGEIVPLASVVM